LKKQDICWFLLGDGDNGRPLLMMPSSFRRITNFFYLLVAVLAGVLPYPSTPLPSSSSLMVAAAEASAPLQQHISSKTTHHLR